MEKRGAYLVYFRAAYADAGAAYPAGRQKQGLISKDLAEKNGLKIGDKIQTDKGVEIEIVGLFSPKEIEGINDQVTTYDKIQNLIITDLATLVAYENGPAIQGFNELTVSVDDPQNMEEIISKVKEISGVDWKAFLSWLTTRTMKTPRPPWNSCRSWYPPFDDRADGKHRHPLAHSDHVGQNPHP